MRPSLYGKSSLTFAILGIFLVTVLPVNGDEAGKQTRDTLAVCESAKKKFLESDNPTSEDAEAFFDCYRVDFTFGTITRINTPNAPPQQDDCQRESEGPADNCGASSRG